MADELPTNFVAVFIRNHFDELLALDHWAAEVVGAPPGFTLSAYACDAASRRRRWAMFWQYVIDNLAVWVWHQRSHCCATLAQQQQALHAALAPSAYTV